MTHNGDSVPLLINALMQPNLYDHPVDHIQLVETHISWVILTGHFVYKIKKPVDLGFLNFSTLAKRKFFCEEEIRLNQRLAPDTYLGVIPITGSQEQPCWEGEGEVIEYAVKMKQFSQQAQLDRMLNRGELKTFHLDKFADVIADFHQSIERASMQIEYGDLEHLYRPVKENFVVIHKRVNSKTLHDKLSELQDWSARNFTRLRSVFEQRKQDGYIRECHGDMHLRNLAWVDDKPLLFDCIEFNPNLRWIDVISEIAFLIMDLHKRGQFQMAQSFLNRYLELTGDYAGLSVLPFYLVYRALVLVKVNAIRAEQTDLDPQEHAATDQALREYLQLAENYTQPHQLNLVITHGFSACGKSTITKQLLQRLEAIRIRSDVVRKHLFGLQAKDSRQSAINQDIYSEQASQQTYSKLVELAEQILGAGFSIIIDAAFLKTEQRSKFQALAEKLNVGYSILDITAPKDVLRQRIQQRSKGVSDADLEVLEHQFKTSQKLNPDEESYVIAVDTQKSLKMDLLVHKINKFL